MRPTDLNLRHLHAVVAAARSGTVSAAARIVNLTQPAITQGIAKLEREIGLSFFDRRPGGMEPTEAVRILAPRAEAALRLIGSTRVTAPQMRAFIALARGGSYAAAAASVGVREASLHRAVADLSIGLNEPLVVRRGRGVALTRQGQLVARRFRLAEAELRSALDELESHQGREVGRIAVGAMPLSRARLLPNAVAAFHRLHPQVDILLAEGSHAELIGPLRDGEIDLMVGALRESAREDDISQRPLFVDRPVVLAGAAHPLAKSSRPPSIDQLAAYSWIVPPEGTPLRAQWRQMFAMSGVEPPRVAVECGSVMLVRQLLIQTDHLTLLSPDQVAVELEAGWLACIGNAPGEPSRIIGAITRAEWRPTPMQRIFLNALVEEAKLIELRISTR
jgi:DNA-binding transcriptional LysR family regulator